MVEQLTSTWSERYVRFAQEPSSDVARGIQLAVDWGYIENNNGDRQLLAEQMGKVFEHLFIEETGGERFVEELDMGAVVDETRIQGERLRDVLHLMVSADLVKSREKIERRKRKQ